jgi:hypothetical protein
MVKGYKGEFFTRFDIYIFTAILHKVAAKACFRRRTFSAELNVHKFEIKLLRTKGSAHG